MHNQRAAYHQELLELDLKKLRDTVFIIFVIINALFVLLIFLMQWNHEVLNIRWPVGQKINVNYNGKINTVFVAEKYFMLEPIGSVFMMFFGVLIGIQFTAMLCHRAGTITQLLSTTHLNFFRTDKMCEVSTNEIIETSSVQLVKELQRLNTESVAFDMAINDWEKSSTCSSMGNLETNFKRNLNLLQDADNDTVSSLNTFGNNQAARRAILRAMQKRCEFVAERKRSLRSSSSSSVPSDYLQEQEKEVRSQYESVGYELKCNIEEEGRRPKRSTVRFRSQGDKHHSSSSRTNRGYRSSPMVQEHTHHPRLNSIRLGTLDSSYI